LHDPSTHATPLLPYGCCGYVQSHRHVGSPRGRVYSYIGVSPSINGRRLVLHRAAGGRDACTDLVHLRAAPVSRARTLSPPQPHPRGELTLPLHAAPGPVPSPLDLHVPLLHAVRARAPSQHSRRPYRLCPRRRKPPAAAYTRLTQARRSAGPVRGNTPPAPEPSCSSRRCWCLRRHPQSETEANPLPVVQSLF
jgi:hypothetical protein